MKSYEIEKIMRNNPNVEVVVKIDGKFYNITDSNWQGFENGGKLELLIANEDVIKETDIMYSNCICMYDKICNDQYYSESLKHNACVTNDINCVHSCPF